MRWKEQRTAEGAQVSRGAFVPEHCMKITRAIPGGPDGLAIVIDGEDGPVRVTADSWEFLDVAVSPDNRLNLQNLGGDRRRRCQCS